PRVRARRIHGQGSTGLMAPFGQFEQMNPCKGFARRNGRRTFPPHRRGESAIESVVSADLGRHGLGVGRGIEPAVTFRILARPIVRRRVAPLLEPFLLWIESVFHECAEIAEKLKTNIRRNGKWPTAENDLVIGIVELNLEIVANRRTSSQCAKAS